jgi:outer membrane protein assembly factor BamB
MAETWSGETGGPIRVGPVVTDTAVWVGSRDGRLYAFDRSSGTQLLSELVGSPIVGLESVGDMLMTLTGKGVVAYSIG